MRKTTLLIGTTVVAVLALALASCGNEDAKPTSMKPVPSLADGKPIPALSEGGAVIEEKLEDVEKCFHDRRALGGPLSRREHAVWREFATAVTSGDDYCVSAWTSYCQFVAKKK
jgi:hypothetical protein